MMISKVILLSGIILLGFFGFLTLRPSKQEERSPAVILKEDTGTQSSVKVTPMTDVLSTNLDTPWALAFLPGNKILITERAGRVRMINENGTLDPNPVTELPQVKEIGEGGLLGITLHPQFLSNKFIYLYYTYQNKGDNTLNRVVRMTFENNRLQDEKAVVDAIPGAVNHNGGRIKFGPDGYLYITTGDAQNPSLAQDKNALGGKILRVTDLGDPAPGNPFSNRIYSYGHRNPQGIAWDQNGTLWATEHGRSGVLSGMDEVNIIKPGENYGWPIIQGDEKKEGMRSPLMHSGDITWAPAGIAFINSIPFFGGLRGESLYSIVKEGNKFVIHDYFHKELGRIREVIAGPDGLLYITTSNRDGRGVPKTGDDQILKINTRRL